MRQRLEAWDAEERHDKITEAFANFMVYVVPVRPAIAAAAAAAELFDETYLCT
jgi:hypothetical protein